MSEATPAPAITVAQFEELLRQTIPMANDHPYSCVSLAWGEAIVRVEYVPSMVRAGGTLSGPTMMTLADTALYAAVLSQIGLEPLAVTADLSFHFLRKPEPKALVARARILKRGRKLAFGTIEIASEGSRRDALDGTLVAHASGTYAIP
ncbi:MAG: PaaI family thioesterase [Sandaracinus sp.]